MLPDNDCRWPQLPEPYELALREAVTYIREHFAAIGIVACGSVIRGCPDASSDLDIVVLHRPKVRQRIQKRCNGVATEFFVNPPSMYEEYFAAERVRRRPSSAHMLATGFIVLETGSIVSELCRRASEELANPPPPTAEELEMARYFISSRYEDVVDIVGREPSTARLLLASVVLEMLNFCFQRAGLYYPRSKELLTALEAVDPEAAALAHRFVAAPDLERQLELAGSIADRTVGARGFFEWESPAEIVVG